MKELVAEDKIEFNEKTQIFPISQGVDFLAKSTATTVRNSRNGGEKEHEEKKA